MAQSHSNATAKKGQKSKKKKKKKTPPLPEHEDAGAGRADEEDLDKILSELNIETVSIILNRASPHSRGRSIPSDLPSWDSALPLLMLLPAIAAVAVSMPNVLLHVWESETKIASMQGFVLHGRKRRL